MPSLHMPLRHYSSRPNDGLRQNGQSDSSVGESYSPHGTGTVNLDKVLPPITTPDFHDRPTASSRTASLTNNGVGGVPRVPFKPPSPRPDFQHKSRNLSDATSNIQTRDPPPPKKPAVSRSPSPVSRTSSNGAYETQATSLDLPALQAQSALEQTDQMKPLSGDFPGSFDLVSPPEDGHELFTLEKRSDQLFSREHLDVIFSSPASLLKFTAFLSTHRPNSVPMLIYYLDAVKALKAIKYANAVAEALSPINRHEFTDTAPAPTENKQLEEKAAQAFTALMEQDLPAYVTQMYVQVVSLSISQRITGTLPPHLRDASEGLAEVFCLTDPSRPDNPIVFASEEFHRTTQYGMNYAIGRNCRFLQGPRTNPLAVRRIGDSIRDGRDHCEVFLNYRRDGSPFMNMLMTAPLCDSRGKIRYFIGAQVDVTGLVKECTDMETLQQLLEKEKAAKSEGQAQNGQGHNEQKDDFQDLSEMLNMAELETVRKYGGGMHREYQGDDEVDTRPGAPHLSRLLLQEPSAGENLAFDQGRLSGRLIGIYQNYLLIRPYPSFRILFASPTLRVPGILQSPFMDKIGGSSRVRNELSAALADGRGVTAKVRWLSRPDEDGRSRWIHCTPLLGSNGQIGVWMVVVVDGDQVLGRRWKQAPPVAPHQGRLYRTSQERAASSVDSITGITHQTDPVHTDNFTRAPYTPRRAGQGGSLRSSSPHSVAI